MKTSTFLKEKTVFGGQISYVIYIPIFNNTKWTLSLRKNNCSSRWEKQTKKQTQAVYLSNQVVIPVLVEAPAALLIEMLSPHSLKGAKTTWCADVAYKSNTHHGGGLHNGHCLHNFLLVGLCKMVRSAFKYVDWKHSHLLPNNATRSTTSITVQSVGSVAPVPGNRGLPA